MNFTGFIIPFHTVIFLNDSVRSQSGYPQRHYGCLPADKLPRNFWDSFKAV